MSFPRRRESNGVVVKEPCVYILASKKEGALYIGVTSDLIQRIWQHKNNVVKGHSSKYKTYKLVYFEQHETMENAILREKRMKKWNRQWKINLIEDANPEWSDLWSEILA